MNKLTLPIEIGKQYVRRDGKIVTAQIPDSRYTQHELTDVRVDGESVSASFAVWLDTGRIHRNPNLDNQADLIADHIPAKGHRHAAEMLAYAQDAAECAEPWTRWESRVYGGFTTGDRSKWLSINCHPLWRENMEYRRRPNTIKLGDAEVNAPLRVAPAMGTEWFALSLRGVLHYEWSDADFCYEHLEKGLVFATKEDAQAALDAILELLKP